MGRPKKIKVTSGEITTMVVDNSDPNKIVVIDVKTEPLPQIENGEGETQDHSEDSPIDYTIPNENGDRIMMKYLELCNTESDINELLPYIYEIAKECEFIIEFGVRRPTTTYALLAAKPKRLVSYDIGRYDEEVTEVENLCAEIGQDFQFILQDILKTEIEETDLIMSDAFHSKTFVEKELRLHAHKARKYIIFHDWISYGLYGEQPYNNETSPYGAGLGIQFAINPFLIEHPEWVKHLELDFNNGLLILKRI